MKLNPGNNIRKYRREPDLTQEQFADRLGVSPQAVSRWKNGTTYPDMELIPVLTGFFGVSLDVLFGYNVNEIKQTVDGRISPSDRITTWKTTTKSFVNSTLGNT